MTGLKDIPLVTRQDDWASFFAELQHELRKLIGDQNHPVEWFGSTSIESVPLAKPVLDIAVAEEPNSTKLAKFFDKRLASTGEKRLQNSRKLYMSKEESIFHVYDRAPEDIARHLTHQIYTIPQYGNWWTRYFHFKRLLTENPELGKMYSDTKLDIARRFLGDIPSYTKAKLPFISSATLIGFEEYGQSNASDETVEEVRRGADSDLYEAMRKIIADNQEKSK